MFLPTHAISPRAPSRSRSLRIPSQRLGDGALERGGGRAPGGKTGASPRSSSSFSWLFPANPGSRRSPVSAGASLALENVSSLPAMWEFFARNVVVLLTSQPRVFSLASPAIRLALTFFDSTEDELRIVRRHLRHRAVLLRRGVSRSLLRRTDQLLRILHFGCDGRQQLRHLRGCLWLRADLPGRNLPHCLLGRADRLFRELRVPFLRQKSLRIVYEQLSSEQYRLCRRDLCLSPDLSVRRNQLRERVEPQLRLPRER